MQIVGSFTPNSAAAERVFSMLKLMFGDTQMSALADMIQAALMLRYNKRMKRQGGLEKAFCLA